MMPAKDLSISRTGTATERFSSGAPRTASSSTSVTSAPPQVPESDQLREALHHSRDFGRALLSTVSDLVFEIRRDGVVLVFHGPDENEFSITSDAVVGKRLMELLPTQIAQLATHYLEKALRTGEAQKFSCQYLVPGRLRYFEARLAVCSPGVALAVVRDVTDRETLEKEVAESSSRVQMRIGQDIHDGLGQHLTGITFLCRALEKNLAAKNIPEATEAGEISKLVIEALAQTRNLARGLFPVEVESTRLCQSLRELAHTAEQLFNVSCTVESDADLVINNKNASTHLFRLAQEAINNAVKHGRAQRVTIVLGTNGDKAVLRIIDDGVGFPTEGAKRSGLGLRIMTYRAQKVSGALEIQSGPHGGTVVTCTFNPKSDEN